MKSPEEIKKGLVEAIEETAWVVEGGDAHDLQDACDMAHASMADALALIQQLEAERDAAVRDCGCFPCQTCEERENGDLCPMCEIRGGYRSFHQWRGVRQEEPPC